MPLTPSETAAARGLWTGLAHGEVSAANLRPIQRGDGVLRLFIRAHFDEGKSACATGCLIAHDVHRLHRPGPREQVLQVRFTDLVRQVSDVQLPTHDMNSSVAQRRSRRRQRRSAGCCLVVRLNFRRNESRLVTLEDGEYAANPSTHCTTRARLGAARAMIMHRIFPSALSPVGVTSRSWPAPPHILLSYETNPFRSCGSDARFTPWWRERIAYSPCSAAGNRGRVRRIVSMSFSKLGLTPSLCLPLARLGYEQPTPIQARAIPAVLTGVDLLARAQTGTGKTAAFGLPMIERIVARRDGVRPRRPRGLVLVPTRELAAQVHRSLSTYGAPAQLRVTAIFGGVGMGPQIQSLTHGTDVVVATPGRLIDHMQRRTVDLTAIEILTLDEADRMLDLGFLPALRRVSASLPRSRQTLLFSATLSEAVVGLAADFTRDPARIDVSDGQAVVPTVTHHLYTVAVDQKRAMLTHVLTQNAVSQALVFCKTKRGSDRAGEHLERAGIKTAVIHGNKSQGARTRALDDFKAGRVRVLVATDIAARGLDIAQLPLVVNYDLPLVAEDYIHRIGRTGRAGRSGRAVSLVSASDSQLLRDIQRLLPVPLEKVAVPGFDATEVAPSIPRHQPRHAGFNRGAGSAARRRRHDHRPARSRAG